MPNQKPASMLSDDELCERLLRLSQDGKLTEDAVTVLRNGLDDLEIKRRAADKAIGELNILAREAREMLGAHDKVSLFSVIFNFSSSTTTSPAVPSGPPKAVENVIWFLLPRKVRDAVMGDAEEAYWQTFERYGSRQAAAWDYGKEAVFAILFALGAVFSRFLKSFRRSS